MYFRDVVADTHFWETFVNKAINNNGVSMLDDHHYGGSVKHLYKHTELKNHFLMLGVYGLDEIDLTKCKDRKEDYIFHGIAPLPSHSGESYMRIYKPLSTTADHKDRELKTEWTIKNNVPRLVFKDKKTLLDGTSIENFWEPVHGCDNERAKLWNDWENKYS